MKDERRFPPSSFCLHPLETPRPSATAPPAGAPPPSPSRCGSGRRRMGIRQARLEWKNRIMKFMSRTASPMEALPRSKDQMVFMGSGVPVRSGVSWVRALGPGRGGRWVLGSVVAGGAGWRKHAGGILSGRDGAASPGSGGQCRPAPCDAVRRRAHGTRSKVRGGHGKTLRGFKPRSGKWNHG